MSKKHLGAANVKVLLEESEIPRQWYNLAADLPTPLQPPLGPDGKPVTPEALSAVFPMNLIEQEVSNQRWIDIPEEIIGDSLPLATQPFAARHLFGKKAEYPGAYLFQE